MKADNLMIFILQELLGAQQRYRLLCVAFAGLPVLLFRRVMGLGGLSA